MDNKKRNIVIGISGASGSLYADLLIKKLMELKAQIENVGVVMSKNAKEIWEYELKNQNYKNIPFKIYESFDFNASFASGSSKYDTMIICPCSMGTLGRISGGISDNLITRTADMMLKERRKLICVIRETPYSLIHLNNMKIVTEAGGIICPASPSFYSLPKNFEELAFTVVNRVLKLANFELDTYVWNGV